MSGFVSSIVCHFANMLLSFGGEGRGKKMVITIFSSCHVPQYFMRNESKRRDQFRNIPSKFYTQKWDNILRMSFPYL